jgi:hypothetical protein
MVVRDHSSGRAVTSPAPRVRAVVCVLGLLAVLSGCVNRAGSTSAGPGPTESATSALPSSPTVTPSSRTEVPTYSPAPAEPTHIPLVPAAIDRVFQVYMNGLANHDMVALSSATCPRLRSTLLGFALHGYYVDRWELLPYEIQNEMDYVTVQADITQRDPNTGQLAGEVIYSWYVERDVDQSYYVCGWLEYQ